MRIGELAGRSGVAASTLRYYEGLGLLPAAGRTGSGYRVYGEDAVERLAVIGAAKGLGLALEEVGAVCAAWAGGVCAEVRAELRPRVAARLAEAEGRAARAAAFAAVLRGALARLEALPEREGRCGAECGFPRGAGAGAPESGPGDGARPRGERWRTAPVACSLGGDGLARRGADWRAALDGAAPPVAIPDGLRLTLPADRTARIAALASAEQHCCPFFDFRLHLDGPVLHLEVRAPAEGAALLEALFGGSGHR
ncbi:MerR family transcriptional regulator [Streptomyces sp. NPDC021020]|uniref:MerR family transcriptional regulator n=1 Tax=Streptomyces sp. NPDC021020 TaxID=3365109 RepID=UPI0037AA387F